MKTIEVSDEVYEFLKDCKNELKTQDNRCTRNPFYTIWHHVKDYGMSEDYGEEYSYIWDEDEFESLEEVFTYMDKNNYEEEILKVYNDNNLTDYTLENYEDHREEIKKWFCDETNSYDVSETMSDITVNVFYRVGIRKREEQVVNGACFSFFEKDAFDHIKLNGHNIKGKKYTYADSLYRTPRMEKLLEILHNLEFKE